MNAKACNHVGSVSSADSHYSPNGLSRRRERHRGERAEDHRRRGVIIFLGAKALLHLRFIVWTTRQRLLEWIHNFTSTSFMEKKRIVS